MLRRLLVTCLVLGLSTRAFADDPPNTPQPMPVAAPSTAAEQDLPYRFRDMLRFEARRARLARYFNGCVYTLIGAGIVSAGVVEFVTIDSSDPRADGLRAQSYVMMSLGGVAVIGALVLTFLPSPSERLQAKYSTYADDGRIPLATRLYDGEQALRATARSEMISRRVVGTTSIAIGVGLAVMAVWRSTLTETTTTDRTVSGTLTAASSLATVGAGIASIWFQRGAAEVMLAHWEASQGRFPEASNHLRIIPLLAPMPGGATAGVRIEL